MSKIYMVRAYFEDFESSRWQIIGLFTDELMAKECAKKWEDFYVSKQSLFDEPKNWNPKNDDWYDEYFEEISWRDSAEYHKRISDYGDIINFKDIEIEEFDLNRDLHLNSNIVNESLMSLMVQWDRNHKLEKIV